jgi:hypothetical protein
MKVTKTVRSEEKGMKGLHRCSEISYDVTKSDEVTKKVCSYEKCMQLQKRYEVTKNVRKGYEEVTK